MGDIDVGGDGSVKWTVDVGQLRRNSAISRGDGGGPPGGHGAGKHHQEGIDETPPGNFTVSIKVPAEAAEKTELANALATASDKMNAAAPSSGYVEFSLPIKPNNTDQIKVRW
jgi:hypothetical protein